MKGLLIVPLAVCCLGSAAHAAPLQDPANVDAAHAPDPAYISQRRAPASSSSGPSSWLSSFLPSSKNSRAPRTANARPRRDEGMPSLTSDDYRQAYGTSDIRARLGRVYNAGGTSSATGYGERGMDWVNQLSSNWGSSVGGMSGNMGSLSETTHPIRNAVDDISRQLMPALQDMRNNVQSELDQASRKSR